MLKADQSGEGLKLPQNFLLHDLLVYLKLDVQILAQTVLDLKLLHHNHRIDERSELGAQKSAPSADRFALHLHI